MTHSNEAITKVADAIKSKAREGAITLKGGKIIVMDIDLAIAVLDAIDEMYEEHPDHE